MIRVLKVMNQRKVMTVKKKVLSKKVRKRKKELRLLNTVKQKTVMNLRKRKASKRVTNLSIIMNVILKELINERTKKKLVLFTSQLRKWKQVKRVVAVLNVKVQVEVTLDTYLAYIVVKNSHLLTLWEFTWSMSIHGSPHLEEIQHQRKLLLMKICHPHEKKIRINIKCEHEEGVS